jgi:pyruvyltransferase
MVGIKVFHHPSPNFGDYIAKEIAEKIHGTNVISISEGELQDVHYIITGSILTQANSNSIVWGAGVAYSYDEIPLAKEFIAVRGHLTEKKIKDKYGINCCTVGDPVMIISELYHASNTKEYRLGIIPHWVDYYQVMAAYRDYDDVLIIDVLKKPADVIRDITMCEKTISSSLHGIVASHAFNIPCCWVKFSNKILGDGFKFLDYFSSVGITEDKPLILYDKQNIDTIINNIINYEIKFDVNKFLSTSPF